AYEDQPPVVGIVMMNSAAERADIRPGDRILSVADRSVKTWEEFFIAIGSRPNREVSIEVLRDGKIFNRRVTPETATGQARVEYGGIGVFPNVHPHLLAISPGEPGERGGLRVGDVVVAVDGKPILFHSDFREVIASHPETPMMVSVLRDGRPQTVSVTPRRKGSIGYLGVTPVDETKSIK